MSILQECPQCRARQKTSNKRCKCGANLDREKKNKRVRYWVTFRLPDGLQRRESLSSIADVDPYSIEDARAVMAKREVQKKEKVPLFEMRRQVQLTFDALGKWYLELESVKALASFPRVKIAIAHFNAVFGDRPAAAVVKSEIDDFFRARVAGGIAKSTASVELSVVKGLVSKACDDELIDAKVLMTFRKVKPQAKRGACARKRTVTIPEYLRIIEASPAYLRGMVILAMNTGMRPGEVKRLRWSFIDRQGGFIRLPAEATKEGAAKNVPLNRHAKAVLDGTVRHLGHDFVFTYDGYPIQGPRGVTRSLKQACKKAGVSYGRKAGDGLTMHDFRRTVKTNMARAGVGDVFRNVILGHALQGMDRHYISLTDDDLRNAMDTYTAWLDREAASVDQTVDQGAVSNV